MLEVVEKMLEVDVGFFGENVESGCWKLLDALGEVIVGRIAEG